MGSLVSKNKNKKNKHKNKKVKKQGGRREGIMKLALMSQASLGTGEFTQYPVLFCKLGNLFRSNPGYGHILGNLLEEEAPYTTFSKRAQRALSVLELYVDWERNASPK